MALVGGSTYKNFDRRETIFLTEDPGGFIFIQAYVKIRDGIQAIIIHSRNSTSVLNDMPKQLLPGQLHTWRIQTVVIYL